MPIAKCFDNRREPYANKTEKKCILKDKIYFQMHKLWDFCWLKIQMAEHGMGAVPNNL